MAIRAARHDDPPARVLAVTRKGPTAWVVVRMPIAAHFIFLYFMCAALKWVSRGYRMGRCVPFDHAIKQNQQELNVRLKLGKGAQDTNLGSVVADVARCLWPHMWWAWWSGKRLGRCPKRCLGGPDWTPSSFEHLCEEGAWRRRVAKEHFGESRVGHASRSDIAVWWW